MATCLMIGAMHHESMKIRPTYYIAKGIIHLKQCIKVPQEIRQAHWKLKNHQTIMKQAKGEHIQPT